MEVPGRFWMNDMVRHVAVLKRISGSKKFRSSPQKTFATWGNCGIEPDKGKGISSPGTYEASLMCLATMESGNGILCRTGRIIEADIDLRGGSDGVGRMRGRGRFRS